MEEDPRDLRTQIATVLPLPGPILRSASIQGSTIKILKSLSSLHVSDHCEVVTSSTVFHIFVSVPHAPPISAQASFHKQMVPQYSHYLDLVFKIQAKIAIGLYCFTCPVYNDFTVWEFERRLERFLESSRVNNN